MIYRIVLSIRNARYKSGRHSTAAEVPTICVGNITVGGTGKTPHSEMILRTLLGSEHWGMSKLAFLSRGYKRRSKGFQQVPYDGSAALYGDAPVQVKRSVRDAAPLSRAAEQVSILKVEPGSYTSVITVSRISSRRVSMSFRGGLLGS